MTPDIYTISEQTFAVSDGHTLYVQEWGNKNAHSTIIFLHGGPGSGCSDGHKTQFDPSQHRVIFFDQRGSGKSIPYGSTIDNTTDKMIDDISALADHFDLKSFVLTGGSWGSTLALAYAIAHPERVKRLILRGIFTGSSNEVSFLDDGKFQAFYPEVWEQFVASVPKEHSSDPSAYHHSRIAGDDPVEAKLSALAYSSLESAIIRLDDRFTPSILETFEPGGSIIESHYVHNLCFMADNYIMDNAHKLNMPIHLVQGRYDMICAPQVAYELSKKLPNCTLAWTIAGHSGSDRENWNLIRALLIAHVS